MCSATAAPVSKHDGGTVYVLNGSNARSPGRRRPQAGDRSVVTADLGAGYQTSSSDDQRRADLRRQVRCPARHHGLGYAFQNAPLVTDDANGTIGITMAGYGSTNQGAVFHYEVAGSTAPRPTRPAPGDVPPRPAADGDAGRRRRSSTCRVMRRVPRVGFYLTGTTEVSSTSATFRSAVRPQHHAQPAGVGIATTTTRRLLAGSARRRDLCVRQCRDLRLAARHRGARHQRRRYRGHQRRNGYWVVASDGGIFTFGTRRSSARWGPAPERTHRGMARDPATGGYWEVASDGGIFTFDAPFLVPWATSTEPADRRHRCGSGWQWLLEVPPTAGSSPSARAPRSTARPAPSTRQPSSALRHAERRGLLLTAADGGVFAFAPLPSTARSRSGVV